MDENPPATGAFLDAEAAAGRLAESLERLRTEAERQGSATANLAQATAAVQGLAASVAETARRTAEATEVLRAIGTPALIEGMEQSRDAIVRAVEGSNATTTEALTELRLSWSRDISTLRTGIEALRAAQSTHARKLARLLWIIFAVALVGAVAAGLTLLRVGS